MSKWPQDKLLQNSYLLENEVIYFTLKASNPQHISEAILSKLNLSFDNKKLLAMRKCTTETCPYVAAMN